MSLEWTDARSVYEQYHLSDVTAKCKLVRRFSVGYLVLRDKERVVLAHTFDPAADDDEADGAVDFLVVPRSWVVKMHDLKAGDEDHEA